MTSSDGAALLTTEAATPIVTAMAHGLGGTLKSWSLDHVDVDPGRATTATYRVDLISGGRVFHQTVGCTVRATGPSPSDRRAHLLMADSHPVACWVYPEDPDLPGLRRAAQANAMAALLRESGIVPLATGADLAIDLVSYRPRRRAVLRVRLKDRSATFYVKAFRQSQFDAALRRHRILTDGGVPGPKILAATEDRLLVIAETPGIALARAVFAPTAPITAQQIVDLLDAMPPEVAELGRRPPWASSVRHYATIVQTALPALQSRLDRLCDRIEDGLAGLPLGDEPTHGDFYEAQVFVQQGQITGLIDVDTIGPGRRADDLACLVAHLNCIQRMNPAQTRQIARLLHHWLPVFDARVDPVELRLRAAAVVISLATGPYRGQESQWPRETEKMVAKAEDLVAQVDRSSAPRRALV